MALLLILADTISKELTTELSEVPLQGVPVDNPSFRMIGLDVFCVTLNVPKGRPRPRLGESQAERALERAIETHGVLACSRTSETMALLLILADTISKELTTELSEVSLQGVLS
jgi:hypothetical protein